MTPSMFPNFDCLCSVFQESFVVDCLKDASLKDEPDDQVDTTSSSYRQLILVHWQHSISKKKTQADVYGSPWRDMSKNDRHELEQNEVKQTAASSPFQAEELSLIIRFSES